VGFAGVHFFALAEVQRRGALVEDRVRDQGRRPHRGHGPDARELARRPCRHGQCQRLCLRADFAGGAPRIGPPAIAKPQVVLANAGRSTQVRWLQGPCHPCPPFPPPPRTREADRLARRTGSHRANRCSPTGAPRTKRAS